MEVFNKKKELKKLNIKQNKNTYIKRISIVLSCLILLIGIILYTFAKFESNQEYVLIKGLVTDALKDVNIVAVYQGSNKVDEIPAQGTGWLFDRAVCTNGATATWNNEDWTININATTKTKCTLYFKQGTNAVTYINNLDKSANALIADGTTDNNLRYTGANPNNYVSFNNELWRIIGVMNNIQTSGGQTQSLLKIRRAESIGNYSWDSSATDINNGYGINQWGPTSDYEGADLMRELNLDYLEYNYVGIDGKWYDGRYNSKATNKPSSTISSSAQKMIETVVWKLGSPNSNNGTYVAYDSDLLTASYIYTHERANTNGKVCTSGTSCNDTATRTSTWTGKVALSYLSDYFYATSGGSTISRATCLNTKRYLWEDGSVSDCRNNDWIFDSRGTQWALAPYAYPTASHSILIINSSGNSSGAGFNNNITYPTVFLKSSIAITGGSGTSADPYIIG